MLILSWLVKLEIAGVIVLMKDKLKKYEIFMFDIVTGFEIDIVHNLLLVAL